MVDTDDRQCQRQGVWHKLPTGELKKYTFINIIDKAKSLSHYLYCNCVCADISYMYQRDYYAMNAQIIFL